MLTKGAIGNLVNRYRAVLQKCNLINTFGSLAVASMLVLGGAGVASAETITLNADKSIDMIKWGWSSGATYEINTEYLDSKLGDHSLTVHNTNGKAINNINPDEGGAKLISIGKSIDEGSVRIVSSNDHAIYLGEFTGKEHSIKAKDIYIEGTMAIYIGEDEYASGEGNGINIEGQTITIKSTASNKNTIQVTPNAWLKISGQNVSIESERTALRSAGGTNIAIKANNLTISTTEDQYVIKGSDADDKITFDVKTATFNGNVESTGTFAASGQFNLNGKQNSFNKIENSSDGGAIEFVVDNKDTKINIKKNTAENLGITGSKALNDEYKGDITKLSEQVNIEDGAEGATLKLPESDILGETTAEQDTNNKVDQSTIQTKRNTLMDAALRQASVTTVALDKILTNDVRKRLGDIRSDKNTTGVWMRWDGGKLQGNGLSNDFNTIQIGGDTKVGKNCRLGVAGTFTHGDAEFARGTAELEGFTFATYATWMGESGMFADVVARLGQFSNEMNVEGRKGDMDNRVFSLSGEYGWRLPVCSQFFIEPQVELAYTYVSSDDLELGTAKYAFDNVNSLTGRAGVVFGWNLPDDRGNVYARASVLQQFMGDAKISGSNGTARNVQEIDGNDTWLEYGIGANVKLTEKTYIWADVERTAGAELDEEWRGTVGIRYSF